MPYKFAVFGGTFDPVHNGHIKIAQYAVNNFGFEKIIFLPNGNPPHKTNCTVTNAMHRFNMVKAAISQFDDFCVSDYEINKKGYSLYTMRYFREKYGKDTYFIIGADSLCSIHKWYEYETLLKENKFIVFFRPSENDNDFFCCIDKYRNDGIDITVANMQKLDISATNIRKKISLGIYEDLPIDKKVMEYIKENNLYGE